MFNMRDWRVVGSGWARGGGPRAVYPEPLAEDPKPATLAEVLAQAGAALGGAAHEDILARHVEITFWAPRADRSRSMAIVDAAGGHGFEWEMPGRGYLSNQESFRLVRRNGGDVSPDDRLYTHQASLAIVEELFGIQPVDDTAECTCSSPLGSCPSIHAPAGLICGLDKGHDGPHRRCDPCDLPHVHNVIQWTGGMPGALPPPGRVTHVVPKRVKYAFRMELANETIRHMDLTCAQVEAWCEALCAKLPGEASFTNQYDKAQGGGHLGYIMFHKDVTPLAMFRTYVESPSTDETDAQILGMGECPENQEVLLVPFNAQWMPQLEDYA